MDNTATFKEIASAIKEHFSLNSDTELAKMLSMSKQNLNSYYGRDSLPINALFNLCVENNVVIEELVLRGVFITKETESFRNIKLYNYEGYEITFKSDVKFPIDVINFVNNPVQEPIDSIIFVNDSRSYSLYKKGNALLAKTKFNIDTLPLKFKAMIKIDDKYYLCSVRNKFSKGMYCEDILISNESIKMVITSLIHEQEE